MKRLIQFLTLLLLPYLSWAANPAYDNFNTNDFQTAGAYPHQQISINTNKWGQSNYWHTGSSDSALNGLMPSPALPIVLTNYGIILQPIPGAGHEPIRIYNPQLDDSVVLSVPDNTNSLRLDNGLQVGGDTLFTDGRSINFGGEVRTNWPSGGGNVSNILYVAHWGNDTNAERGRIDKPWRTVYDVREQTNSSTWKGAYFSAQAGDTIVILPGTNQLALIPIPDNVNLWIQPGAQIEHINFSNATLGGVSSPVLAGYDAWGPFIQPGNNSRVVSIGSFVSATNNQFNAIFGWYDRVPTTNHPIVFPNTFNVWNRLNFQPKTNYFYYPGETFGGYDNVVLFQTNTSPSWGYIEGGVMKSGYDALSIDGAATLTTKNITLDSTNTYSPPSLVRGAFLQNGCVWNDYNSVIIAGGGTNQTAGVYATTNAVVTLNNTSIKTTTAGQAITNDNGATINTVGISTNFFGYISASKGATIGTNSAHFDAAGNLSGNITVEANIANSTNSSGALPLFVGDVPSGDGLTGFTNDLWELNDTNNIARIHLAPDEEWLYDSEGNPIIYSQRTNGYVAVSVPGGNGHVLEGYTNGITEINTYSPSAGQLTAISCSNGAPTMPNGATVGKNLINDQSIGSEDCGFVAGNGYPGISSIFYYNSTNCQSRIDIGDSRGFICSGGIQESINCTNSFYATGSLLQIYLSSCSNIDTKVGDIGRAAIGFSTSDNVSIDASGHSTSVRVWGESVKQVAIDCTAEGSAASLYIENATNIVITVGQSASIEGRLQGFNNVAYTVPAGQHWVINSGTTNITILGGAFTIQTNFISGKMYVNNSGREQHVQAMIGCTMAAVTGAAAMELRISDAATGNMTNQTSFGTTVASLGVTYRVNMSGQIPVDASYCFTNTSSGSGNSAVIGNGTGQLTQY